MYREYRDSDKKNTYEQEHILAVLSCLIQKYPLNFFYVSKCLFKSSELIINFTPTRGNISGECSFKVDIWHNVGILFIGTLSCNIHSFLSPFSKHQNTNIYIIILFSFIHSCVNMFECYYCCYCYYTAHISSLYCCYCYYTAHKENAFSNRVKSMISCWESPDPQSQFTHDIMTESGGWRPSVPSCCRVCVGSPRLFQEDYHFDLWGKQWGAYPARHNAFYP